MELEGTIGEGVVFGKYLRDFPDRWQTDPVVYPLDRILLRGSQQSFGGNVIEGTPIALQRRLAAGDLLPALADDVAVLRIQLDQPGLAPRLLAGDQRRARSAEGIEHDILRLARIADCPLH